MNPTFLLIIILSLFSIVDFLDKSKYNALQREVYLTAFVVFVFVVCVKYYYGSDILSYVPYYENIANPSVVWKNGINNSGYEFGFELFCSILKYLGCTFWLMTFVISIIYFYAIFKLFKELKRYKIFALLLLIFFEYNLVFFEYRQSLSVSFFVLSFIAFNEKKYYQYATFSLLAILFHKAGLIICLLSLLTMKAKFISYNRNYYLALIVFFVAFLFIPIKPVFLFIADNLSLRDSVRISIFEHIDIMKTVQIIAVPYFLTLYVLYFYVSKNQMNANWDKVMILFFTIIVVLYQDYFLLNRIRSYFAPIAIVYVINSVDFNSQKHCIPFYKELLILSFYVTIIVSGLKLNQKDKKMISGVNEFTTVFDLRNSSAGEIKNEKMKRAKVFWENEYKRKKK